MQPDPAPPAAAAAAEPRATPAALPPRVVIDTPTVLSALLFGGASHRRLRRAWRHGYCRPLVCKATLLGLTRDLASTARGLSGDEQRRLLGEYLPHALRVRVPAADVLPSDSPPGVVLAQLAMAGRAHVLVSGDAELLALHGRLPCAVLAMEPFLEWLAGRPVQPLPRRAGLRPINLTLPPLPTRPPLLLP